MISVNELIQQAYTRSGLVGEGQAVNGTKAKSALHELNDLIQSLNQQEYISDNLKVFEVSSNGSISIGDCPDYDIQIERTPTHIKSVGRKIGDRFVSLISSNIQAIDSVGKHHLSSQYTYNVDCDKSAKKLSSKRVQKTAFIVESMDDLPEIPEDNRAKYAGYYFWSTSDNSGGFCMGVSGDERGTIYAWVRRWNNVTEDYLNKKIYEFDLGVMKGTITLDSNSTSTYKVIFIDEIPEYTLSDTIYLQDMYKSLLLAGLTYRLAIRYKLQDWIQVYRDDFDEQKSLIKRINQTNRNMVWNQLCGSYIDDYYNGRNGGDW